MKIKLFHGSNILFDKFEVQNEPTGSQQEGPGMYFTTSFEDAMKYGRYIYEVEWTYQKQRLISNKPVSEKELRKSYLFIKRLCKKAPDWEDTCLNFDENPIIGLEKAVEEFITYSESYLDLYQSVDSDFYRSEGKLFCKNLGWFKDGFILDKTNTKHVIAFNPESVKILKIHDKNEMKECFVKKIIKESKEKRSYTMYHGCSINQYNNVWKNKNLKQRETNVTSDLTFAFDYSYDFDIGKYDDIVVEINNIPIEAFIAYRNDDYEDDEDFVLMDALTNEEKEEIINNYSLFLVSLYEYKDIISTKVINL